MKGWNIGILVTLAFENRQLWKRVGGEFGGKTGELGLRWCSAC